ncbi:MAG: hypothetical protein ACJ8C4_03745 [Gemmataceae bacterium]
MPKIIGLTAWTLLFATVPLLADDKSKEPTKGAAKPAADFQKYQIVNKISGKITKIDIDEMKITVETVVAVPTSSGKKLTAQTPRLDLDMASDVRVRSLKLPERFDEHNKPKPYTEEEKRQKKGDDPKLPGYMAELKNLTVGQAVEVHMGVRKPAPGSPKNKDKDVMGEKPTAVMILVTLEENKSEKKK